MTSKDPVVGVVVPLEGKGESEDRKPFSLAEAIVVRVEARIEKILREAGLDEKKAKTTAQRIRRELKLP